MEIFVAIAESGQLTRAADNLGLTKSAVSHAVAGLESYLGVQLFQRSARGVQLSEAGRDYYSHCLRIISDINEMEDQTRNVDSALRGRIKVTAPTMYAIIHLVPMIAEFSETYPDVDVTLDLSERTIDLNEEQIDVAVRISLFDPGTARAEFINKVKLYLCAAPEFLDTRPKIKSLDDLKQVNCLKYSGMTVWRLLDSQDEMVTFQPKGKIITNNGEAIRNFAIAGSGVCYMPDFLADEALADGRLVPISLTGLRPLTLDCYVLYPSNRHRPLRVRRFVEFLTERLTA